VLCDLSSGQEMRSFVTASLKPARSFGEVWSGDAGDSKSHCQVVRLRGTIKMLAIVQLVGNETYG